MLPQCQPLPSIKHVMKMLKIVVNLQSSADRARLLNRVKLSQNIVNEFKENAEFLVLHWDGKLTKERYGNQFKPLSAEVPRPPTHKDGNLLGVQPLPKATAIAQAEATVATSTTTNRKSLTTVGFTYR